MRLKDKTVLITGGSAGIGLAAARQAAAEGARVVIAARGREALDAAAAELGVLALQADVGDNDACRRLIEETVSQTGRLDVLVNNAGAHFRGDLETRTADEVALMVDVNLRAPIYLTRLALPHLVEARGAVVNVASLAGFVPLPGAATYSSTKAGLRAFSRALKIELAGKVRIALVSPGPVDTGFIMDELDEVEDIVFSQPMSTADEVGAEVVRFAIGGDGEVAMPLSGGILGTLGYLAPSLRQMLWPLLVAKGRRTKEALRARRNG
jgi:NAD(P)-dependent dehydrogenase (short-subunit alcohol dehydrogenase family)